jgi:hypothetical protein
MMRPMRGSSVRFITTAAAAASAEPIGPSGRTAKAIRPTLMCTLLRTSSPRVRPAMFRSPQATEASA